MTGREWDAAAYHRLSHHQHEWGRKVLARLSPRGDETIMDAGCGTGRLTLELAQRLPRGRVLAVDLSENMLRTAREHFQHKPAAVSVGRIEIICADLAALPFRAAAEDIFSTAAFHWVRNHDLLFRSLFVALKPGGCLEAQCGGGPNLTRVREQAESLLAREPYAQFFAGWTPPQFYADKDQTMARLLHSGFTEVNTWIEPAGFSISDPDEYRAYIAAVIYHRHLERISDAALGKRFLDEMVALGHSSEPRLYLDYWRLNIHARKPGT